MEEKNEIWRKITDITIKKRYKSEVEIVSVRQGKIQRQNMWEIQAYSQESGKREKKVWREITCNNNKYRYKGGLEIVLERQGKMGKQNT